MIKNSFKTSFKTSLEVLKLIIPMYLIAELLMYFDIVKYLVFLIEPFTQLLSLPKEASLSILSGVLINEYASVAFAATLELTPKQWTVLGVFVGICHALVAEAIIMKKIGISNTYNFSLRLFTAFFVAYLTSILPDSFFHSTLGVMTNTKTSDYSIEIFPFIIQTLKDAFVLCVKVIFFITILIIILDFIKLKMKNLAHSTKFAKSYSLMVGILLGVTYGAGILIKELSNKSLEKKDILYISTFLLICHAILEDTLLFVILGADFFIIVIMRFIFAFMISYIVLKIYKRFQIYKHKFE